MLPLTSARGPGWLIAPHDRQLSRGGIVARRFGRRCALAVSACMAASGLALVVSAPSADAATYTAPVLSQQVNLNAGWRFNAGDVPGAQAVGFDDSAWSTVAVPHTWNGRDA